VAGWKEYVPFRERDKGKKGLDALPKRCRAGTRPLKKRLHRTLHRKGRGKRYLPEKTVVGNFLMREEGLEKPAGGVKPAHRRGERGEKKEGKILFVSPSRERKDGSPMTRVHGKGKGLTPGERKRGCDPCK